MKSRISYLLFIGVLGLVVLNACRKETFEPPAFPDITEEANTPYTAQLHWIQNDQETKEEVDLGLKWCFSYLGASLPEGYKDASMRWSENDVLTVDFSKLGFNENALNAIQRIIDVFKSSKEYQKHQSVDMGRFVYTIFNNSNHYYEIAGVPKTLAEFENSRQYNRMSGAIIESSVSFGSRLIKFPKHMNSGSMIFKAQEMEESIPSEKGNTQEFELFDIMKNGQPRFAIYDKDGNLVTGADKVFSTGGKPAKCFWCHESKPLQAFSARTNSRGFYSIAEFDSIIKSSKNGLDVFRSKLISDFDFMKVKEHTQLEKLYIRFMEPSAKRISKEWGVSESEVESTLSIFQTHIHDEFPEMGSLYHRKDVDLYSPFAVIPVGANARESVGVEPNVLQ